MRQAVHQNYEASVSGGSENTTVYSSLGYQKQEGLVENSSMEMCIRDRANTLEYLKAKFPEIPLILLPEMKKGSEELPDIRPLL